MKEKQPKSLNIKISSKSRTLNVPHVVGCVKPNTIGSNPSTACGSPMTEQEGATRMKTIGRADICNLRPASSRPSFLSRKRENSVSVPDNDEDGEFAIYHNDMWLTYVEVKRKTEPALHIFE